MRISSSPASAISDGAGSTSWEISPSALPNCHNASRITGDAQRAVAHLRARRWAAGRGPAGRTGAEAGAAGVVTVWVPLGWLMIGMRDRVASLDARSTPHRG
ncbi:hypothetical protein MSZK_19400 [Mycobacterium sp. shizuoka-1]|nr:hypothetical protein MSZK_19400 [Mycobacterium sp. shizuoka-1]